MARTAMVTGASEGIGYELAKKLAKNGYLITGVARNEIKLKALVLELGAGHKYVVADLSNIAGQEKVASALTTQHYDLLVNNAGVGLVGQFTDIPVDKQLNMMSLNCGAIVRLSHAYLKTSQAGDTLINVSSTLAFTPMPGLGLYCATKSFVTAFTECLWYEQRKRGVYVLGLHPGITSTNFQVNAGGRVEDLPKGLAQTPEQVADVVIEALQARLSPTIISGIKNKIFAGMFRFMPRKAMVNMTGGMMKQ